ncbi:MAG TPA: hypothetical protein VIT65_06705 [Microlunatus sp.]
MTAPAGYGKSTLLAQWAASEDRGVGWVSLDRFDDDPAALLSLVATAYAQVSGQGDLVDDVQGLGAVALSRAAPLLAAALRTSPIPFVLMLDDSHELRSPGCLDVLGVLISGLPQGSQLVLASRQEQPHLSRLRATGDVIEFVAADLALDAAGAAQVFAATRVNITHPRYGCRGRRPDRRMAGRGLPRSQDRQRQRRQCPDDHRRRPLRG